MASDRLEALRELAIKLGGARDAEFFAEQGLRKAQAEVARLTRLHRLALEGVAADHAPRTSKSSSSSSAG